MGEPFSCYLCGSERIEMGCLNADCSAFWVKRLPRVKCLRCGSWSHNGCGEFDPTWRWAGDHWQHRCRDVYPLVGHWDMTRDNKEAEYAED